MNPHVNGPSTGLMVGNIKHTHVLFDCASWENAKPTMCMLMLVVAQICERGSRDSEAFSNPRCPAVAFGAAAALGGCSCVAQWLWCSWTAQQRQGGVLLLWPRMLLLSSSDLPECGEQWPWAGQQWPLVGHLWLHLINLCFLGERQQAAGLKVWKFCDNFGTVNYFDTKAPYWLSWYCILRLKFNRQSVSSAT